VERLLGVAVDEHEEKAQQQQKLNGVPDGYDERQRRFEHQPPAAAAEKRPVEPPQVADQVRCDPHRGATRPTWAVVRLGRVLIHEVIMPDLVVARGSPRLLVRGRCLRRGGRAAAQKV
jgi:hypothetical protein